MTKIPLMPQSSRFLLPCQALRHFPLGLPHTFRITMTSPASGGAPAGNYPHPLSPPYPALSKDVELSRAMSAAARSGAYSLLASDIVFEDEWLVVANKPSGIYCEALLSSLLKLTVDGQVFDHIPHSSNGQIQVAATIQPELHLANRLDRDTSGLMVITKSHKVAARLVKAFTEHRVKKTYLALCVGSAPGWEKIRISSGHGRSKFGAWRVYSVSDVGRTLPGGSMVKGMATSLEVLSVNGRGEFKEAAQINSDRIGSLVVEEQRDEESRNAGEKKQDEVLVRAYPESGRTHQIRLHCQHLGIPIKGDVKYGGVYEWKGMTCEAHTLHAESLSFEHPVTRVLVQFCAPVPSWASNVCRVSFEGS